MFRYLLLPVALLLAACTSVEQTFPDRTPEQVWNAMVAVAETPEYGEPEAGSWQVKENVVWIDEELARIEIYRELARVEDVTSVSPDVDTRTWRFRVTLEANEPPTASFVSRSRAWPTHAKQEARRYFREVRSLLGGAGDVAEGGTASAMDTDADGDAGTGTGTGTEDTTGTEGGAAAQGGAFTPEQAVQQLLYAMFINAEWQIRALTVAHPDLELLWQGETADEFLPPEAQGWLDEHEMRRVEVGETIQLQGEDIVVSEEMVNADHQVILAQVAGEELAPFLLVRTASGLWKVDPEPIIARRRGSEG